MSPHESSHWENRTDGFGTFTPSYYWWAYPIRTHLLYRMLDRYCHSLVCIDAMHEVLELQNRLIDFDVVKNVIALYRFSRFVDWPATVCVIGDGYGIMASLVKTISPRSNVIVVNLKKILPYDYNQCSKISDDFRYIPADYAHHLNGEPIDLFINVASMQEMNYTEISRYFDIMRSSKGNRYFYSLNRQEKSLPDGLVIRECDYPWKDSDHPILKSIPDWYAGYPTQLPPFWEKFDGPVVERFVRLSYLD